MAKLMIQGTASSVGKSIIATALARIFTDMGYNVAPFKAQNMSRIYAEIGDLKISSAQALQAVAAKKNPDYRMNPVLLIPSSDTGSEIWVNGRPIGNMSFKEYLSFKSGLTPIILEDFKSLEAENDLIIIEGAGSPAEINLWEGDFVNMGLANMIDSPVLLVGDIDRGGVFAALYGTVMLMPEKERARIKGLIINKFRGDVSLLEPGILKIEELLTKPVLGVIPFTKLELKDEDSLIDYEKMCNSYNQTPEEIDKELDRFALIVRKELDAEKISEIAGL